jgi:hypothetical protein
MRGKGFKKVDHIDCKIIAFEVKKGAYFIPCKTRSINFDSSWLKTFGLQKLEDFLMLCQEIELRIHKKSKNPKNLYFHSLKGH